MQSCHALVKLTSSSASVVNVTTGKVVKLASLQPLHVLVKFVPLDKSKAGNSVSELHPNQQDWKSVPLDRSSVPGNSVNELQSPQLYPKFVPLDKSKALGNSLSELQPYQQP